MMPRHCCPPPKFKRVTHVIFDLDGTILDTEGIYFGAISEICASYGSPAHDGLKQMISGTVEADCSKIVVREMNLPISPEEFVKLFREKTKQLLGNSVFMPGAEKFIRHLHVNNIPIAIATSSAKDEFFLKTMRHRDVFDLFHHKVCGGTDCQLKRGKPAPDIFLICASRFPDKPKPSRCLVLEDSVNGMKAGLSAGMQTIIIPETSVSYEMWKLATMRLDSMEQIIPELFGLPPFDVETPTQQGEAVEVQNQEVQNQIVP